MTRLPKTVPPDNDNPLQPQPAEDEQEQEQDRAIAKEEEREIAIEAWKMGRKLRASNRGLRTARIPRMHPGWRSGR